MKFRLIIFALTALLLLSAVSLVSCNGSGGDGKDSMYLFLVNKSNPIDSSYSPNQLVTVNSGYTTGGKMIELDKKTAEAALQMLDAMKQDGISGVTITSGYRTYEYQKSLFDRYCSEEKAAHPTWSDEEVKNYVLSYSAYPGTSEHHTGLCIDLITTEMTGLWNWGSETPNNPYDKGFAETAAFEWLQENAHKYGFILRFPEDKTNITGYSYESWHYRYVGVNHATKIYEEGITLEEYLGK